MTTRQIPVIVLAGFLGSGKTTLLNHLLGNSGGTRIGAVVNDFGSIDIDAMTVAGQVDSMVSLGNGCMCCAVDSSELDEYLGRLARPEARIDIVVIEASGLAEPQELIRMVLASEDERIVYGGLVEVVDGAEFSRTRTEHPEIERHLAIADLVVLNKADRTGDEERRRLLTTLTELGKGTPVVAASYGRIDPELLFDRRSREDGGDGARQLSFEDFLRELGQDDEADDHSHHPHAAYDTVSFTSPDPLHPRRLMDFLDSRPRGLYRIKGFVHFGVGGHRQKFTVHAVGDFLRFYPSPWDEDEPRLTQLVLIGTGVDTGALSAALEACRAPEGTDSGDDRAMWGVLRYVPSDDETRREEDARYDEDARHPDEPDAALGELVDQPYA